VATSREIVDGDRPSRRRAIDRNASPPASPREISSRSVNDNRNGDRTGSGTTGRRALAISFQTVRCARPISLPITRLGHPCADSSAIRHFSNSDNRSPTTTPPDRSNSIERRDALTP
jgi:hypothetical protein